MKTILISPIAPGRAELKIQPWTDTETGVAISIMRNEGEPYFHPQARTWVGDQQWIQLQGATIQGDSLVMTVEADFVDTLIAGTQGPRCRASVRVDGGEPMPCALRIDSNILPSTAAGVAPSVGGSSTIVAAEPAPVAEPEPTPEPVAPQPEPAPAPPPPAAPEDKQGKSKLVPLLIALAVLLAAVAAAAYFFLSGSSQDSEAPAEPEQAAAAPSGCEIAALAGADAMTFVQTCARDVQDSGQLLNIIQAARDQGQCEIAQRLYANRANSGDALIAFAYAQEYDPQTHRKEQYCFQSEAATAAYWYESVLENHPEHVQARERLDALAQ